MNSSPNSERSRLARELHDGLAQDLSAIGYRIDSLIGDVTITQSVRENLRKLRFTLSGVTDQVRNEIYNLRNEAGQTLDKELETQLSSILLDTEIILEITGQCQIPREKHYEVSRCLRELTINSRNHSGCTKISITLTGGSITYQDDGTFAQSNDANPKRNSYGLLGVSERLAKIDATLIKSDSTYEIMF
jgi:two-component system, NarL family, sensor histidine kinase LiaS